MRQYRHSLAVPPRHSHGRIQRHLSNPGRDSSRTSHNISTGQRSVSLTGAHRVFGHGIARLIGDPDGPWMPRTFDVQPDLSPISQTHYDFSTYRDVNALDNLSDAGYTVPIDSAYVSQAAASVYSAPVEPSAELLTDSIDPRLGDQLRIDDTASIRSSNAPSDRPKGSQRRASSSKRYIPTKCPHCDEIPKCESDHK
jgi:hypothetical protein